MMKSRAVVVGVDLGGTNVRTAVYDTQGAILSRHQAPIEAARGPDVGLGHISNLIETALGDAEPASLQAIGIGSTGPLDRTRGAIQNPWTLPTWKDVDIVSPLSAHFHVPVILENDADAAALGEYWQGAGKGVRRLCALTVGTGVGTGFILDGSIYRGWRGLHGEVGHQVLDPSGPECYCGAHGCMEALIAGPALGKLAREKAAAGENSLMREMAGGNIDRIDARTAMEAARRGDPAALEVSQHAGKYLGLGLVNIIAFFAPEVIVLGGIVMSAYDLLQPMVCEILERHSVLMPSREVRIVPAELGDNAGVCGAALTALQALPPAGRAV
jgi:glucokinase